MKNFRQLVKDFSIEIPIIQRDYVQGRDDDKAKEIRKSFLDDIFKSLEKDEKFHLDFVYGSFEETKFIPIDGQQRLTTLFLLYWYFSKIENREFNATFTYKTRVSSREFCEKIFDFKIDFSKEYMVSEQILNSKEFIPFWVNDPTIKSMLIMIDEIHNRRIEIDYFDRLDNISFEVFELEDFGKEQSEELYRKMNSRGKSLTAFENFKAIIEQIVYSDKVRHRKIAEKFERKWVDSFWKNKYVDKNSLIDNSFMNFVYFITEMLSFEQGEDNRDKVRSFSFLKEFYQDKDNLSFLEQALDDFEKVEILSQSIEENFLFFEKNTKIHLLKELVDNYSTSTITNKILLYLIIKNININIDKINIEFLIRIARNILYRYRALRRAGATEYTLNLNYEQVSNLLNSFGKFKDNPYESILTITYSDTNFSHEKEKAKLIKSNPKLLNKIFELEDYRYIKGDLRIFFHKDFKFETIDRRIEFLSDNLKVIFEQKDSLIIQSLLSIDDYSLWVGSVMNGDKHFFGQKNRWEIFLTSNPKSIEKVKIYSDFFDEYKKVKSLEKMIKNRLNEYEKEDKDWIYYFLKYPIILQTKNSLSNTFGWLKKHDFIEKLEKETRITSWHVNIYLLALLNELKKEINSDVIKIDEETGLSHLEINKKRITIKNKNIVYKKINYPLFEKIDAIEMVKKIM